MEPSFLFADEPTGALDTIGGDNVMKIFKETNTKKKTTIIMVTHDPDYAKEAGRLVVLADGQIVPNAEPKKGTPAA